MSEEIFPTLNPKWSTRLEEPAIEKPKSQIWKTVIKRIRYDEPIIIIKKPKRIATKLIKSQPIKPQIERECSKCGSKTTRERILTITILLF
jgi:hypothetical protein